MFRSRYYLIGIVIGVLICAGAGRIASSHGSFRNFSRFFILIQPQDSFFPTLSQLVATAKSLATPDKTLVLVGSSSIFRGTGQNPNDLWTIDLQKRLGNEFVVLNYAIDQANITSFAGAVFRALRDLYPKILFVSLADIRGAAPIDGDPPYQYLFWDGYYKGLLHLNADEETAAARTRSAEIPTADGIEIHVGSWLDSLFYFKDLWSYIGYNYFFTIWNVHTTETPLAPRASYVDATDPNMKDIQVRQAADLATINLVVERMAGLIGTIRIERDSSWQNLRRTYTTAFSDEWRPRILLVMLRINPDYLRRMSETEQKTYDSITIEQGSTLRSLGYRTIDVGADWAADDFMDIGHLSARGGSKLSEAVALEVKALSARRTDRR